MRVGRSHGPSITHAVTELASNMPVSVQYVRQVISWLTSGWDLIFLQTPVFFNLLLGALGLILGGQLGAGNTPQDQSFYPTKSQPDRPHLTLIREGFWLGSWALTKIWICLSIQISATSETRSYEMRVSNPRSMLWSPKAQCCWSGTSVWSWW